MAEDKIYVWLDLFDAMLSWIVGNVTEMIVIDKVPETEEEATAAIPLALARGEVIIAGPESDGNDRVIVIQPVQILGLSDGVAGAAALLDQENRLVYAVPLEESVMVEVGANVRLLNWCIRNVAPTVGCVIPVAE